MDKKNASSVERISLCRSRFHANSYSFPCHPRIFTVFPCGRMKSSRRGWNGHFLVREAPENPDLSGNVPAAETRYGKRCSSPVEKETLSVAAVFQILDNTHTRKSKFSQRKGILSVWRRCYGKGALMALISFHFQAAFHKRPQCFTRQTGTYRMGCCIRPEID